MFNPSVALQLNGPQTKGSLVEKKKGARCCSVAGRTKWSGFPCNPLNHESKRSDKKNYSYTPPPGKRQAGFCRPKKILPSFQFYIITKRPLAATTASILHKKISDFFFYSSSKRDSPCLAPIADIKNMLHAADFFFYKPPRHLKANPPPSRFDC